VIVRNEVKAAVALPKHWAVLLSVKSGSGEDVVGLQAGLEISNKTLREEKLTIERKYKAILG
jgi:hypothetical protein